MQCLNCAGSSQNWNQKSGLLIASQLLSLLSLCGADWSLTMRFEDWAETESPLRWRLSCSEHGVCICLGLGLSSKMNQLVSQRKKNSSVPAEGTWIPISCWKFLPMEKSCRAAFLTVDVHRTYVLSIFGTLLLKFVSLYLSNSLAPCPSVSCPFYKMSA